MTCKFHYKNLQDLHKISRNINSIIEEIQEILLYNLQYVGLWKK